VVLALTASARRSVQPLSRGRASSPWSTLPEAGHGDSRLCPACGVHPFGYRASGIRLSSRPVSGHLESSSRGPAVGRLLSSRPVSSRPVSSRPVSAPSVRSRPSPSTSGGGVGDSGRAGRATVTTGTGGGPVAGGPATARRRSRRPGRGRRCRSRVGHWEGGGGPGPPGWMRAAAAPAPERPGRPGRRAERPWRAAARWARERAAVRGWLHRTRGGRPRLGARPRWVVVAEPDARVGGPGGATGGAGGDGRAAPARPKPAASALGSLPAVL
jgi:hypothetical protein